MANVTIKFASAVLCLAPCVAFAGDCDAVIKALGHDPRIEVLDSLSSKSTIVASHPLGGSMTIICGGGSGETDLVLGVNTGHADGEVFTYFGRLAKSVTGVDAGAAEKAAIACEKSARGYKKDQSGLFEGDQVRSKALRVDCRLGDNFVSLGISNAAPPGK